MHLRRRPDQGDRQPGQGRRLVRQRVGLLQPPRRPHRARRRDALSRRCSTLDDLIAARASRAGGSWSAPTSTSRCDGRRAITDDGRIRASLPVLTELLDARRAGDRRRAPRPAEGRARTRSTRCARSPTGWPSCSAARSSSRSTRSARARGCWPTACRTASCCCWRTSGSTPGETSKDDAERREFARCAGRAHRRRRRRRRLRRGRVRRGAPQARLGLRRRARCCRTTAATWCATSSTVLRRLTGDPERPYVVVLGGSKVSDKLAVIESLLPKVDRLLVGGGMCFTFLAAQGHEVGDSLLEADQIDTCRRLLAEAGDKIVLPTDVVVAAEFAADAATQTVAGRRDPGRAARASTSARTSVARVRRRAAPTRGRCSGTGRWACSRWRRSRPAPGASPRRSPAVDGLSRRRWRRLGRRGARARARRERLRAHLDRRRRVAGVPRGQGAARRRRAGRGLTWPTSAPPARPLIAGNWKMNLNHLEAIALVAEDRVQPQAEQLLDAVEVVGAAAVRRPAQRADARSTATGC